MLPNSGSRFTSFDARVEGFDGHVSGVGVERKSGDIKRKAWDIAYEKQTATADGRAHHERMSRDLSARRTELLGRAERYLRDAVGRRVDPIEAHDIVQVAMIQTAVFAYDNPDCVELRVFNSILNRRAIEVGRRLRRLVSIDAGWDHGERTMGDALVDPHTASRYTDVEDASDCADLVTQIREVISSTQFEAAAAVAEHDGDLDAAARSLGISKSALTTRTNAARVKLLKDAPQLIEQLTA